ncbi:transposase family protein [Streptomyces sp. NPDC001137]|uniref:transposase family protein n=1 Tax=Streptomyces sp. NPDC001137 TaxID=3154378 RepID=UPI00332EB99C
MSCGATAQTSTPPARIRKCRTCLPGGRAGPAPEPRRVRGRRLPPGPLLALCLVAVLGGAVSLAAIARFAADADRDLCERLELTAGTPNASTLGRLSASLNGDTVGDAVGSWLARCTADAVDEPGDMQIGLALAADRLRDLADHWAGRQAP